MLSKTELCSLFGGNVNIPARPFQLWHHINDINIAKLLSPLPPALPHLPTPLACAKFALHAHTASWTPATVCGVTRQNLQNQRFLDIVQPAERSSYIQPAWKSPGCSSSRVNYSLLWAEVMSFHFSLGREGSNCSSLSSTCDKKWNTHVMGKQINCEGPN